MQKKIPLRKCLATQELLPKMEMFRVVRTPDNNVLVDGTGKVNGRGAYIKKSEEAIQIAEKRNVLGKALEIEIPSAIYTKMRDLLR